MEGVIEIGRFPRALPKGFALLNLPERENIDQLKQGRSKTMGWTPRGRIISCLEGSLWVTQEQDLEDYILGPGESFMVTVPGRVIVQALEDATFTVNHSPRKTRFNGSYEKSIFK